VIFRDFTKKNPLLRGLSMNLPFEIRAIIAIQMVGGVGFEPTTSTV
jgi:hypothetical protein